MNDEMKEVMPISNELDPRLHAYQRQAVQHLRDNPRAALFLEMLPWASVKAPSSCRL